MNCGLREKTKWKKYVEKIGETIIAPVGIGKLGSLPVQIAAAMLAGVWYVGAGADKFQKLILKSFRQ